MASLTLYPPILDSIAPAFVGNEDGSGSVDLKFSLSKFNTGLEGFNVHVSVKDQATGVSVVKKVGLASTGVILNKSANYIGDGYYTVTIAGSELINGWEPGSIYRVQIRLSTETCNVTDEKDVSSWLTTYASCFSEWSTACTTKAIVQPHITITEYRYDSRQRLPRIVENTLYLSSLDFYTGSYECMPGEDLYSYRVRLIKDGEVIEDSGDLLSIENKLQYEFKSVLDDDTRYTVRISYKTVNLYEESFDINAYIVYFGTSELDVFVHTIDHYEDELKDLTSLSFEEEEGIIAYKLYTGIQQTSFSGNICVKRASSKDNFIKWETINLIPVKGKFINDLPMFYDYTAESGIFYKYGIQFMNKHGQYSEIQVTDFTVRRQYEFSYLLGEDNQQLKLPYNVNVNSFNVVVKDALIETIGSKYPYISREGAINYRTFPLGGTITYNMDDSHFFLAKDFTYGYTKESHMDLYDYNYEKSFREEVIKFLCNSKVKLFKSPTEGNMIIRLTGVSFTPNKTLNRMVYDFAGTATEIDDAIVEKYLKYKLLQIPKALTDFSYEEYRLGQWQGSARSGRIGEDILNRSDNIIELIYNDHPTQTIGDITETLDRILDLSITIDTNHGLISGVNDVTYPPLNPIVIISNKVNGNTGGVLNLTGNYFNFGEEIIFNGSDWVSLINQANIPDPINVTVDYVYVMKHDNSPYANREILEQAITKNYGSYINHIEPSTNIRREIEDKYRYTYAVEGEDSTYIYQEVNKIYSVFINAEPGTVLSIGIDNNEPQDIMIPATGTFNIDNVGDVSYLAYLGEDDINILVNYTCRLVSGKYRESK